MNNIKAKEKVIVTGATGFVGQHLIPKLLQNGYDVLAIARKENKAQSFDWFDDVEFIASDISKGAKHFNINSKMSLIHLAWSGLPNYNSAFHFEENLPKSYEFIKSCIQCGLSRVLVTGTCLEYGFQSGPISSDTKPFPSNPYAFAKDVLRQQLEFLAKESPFSLLWARLFYIYGDGQSEKSLLGQLKNAINNISSNKSTVFGYYVNDPQRYGVAAFDFEGNVTSIEEKPKKPKSNFAVVGLYFYTNDVIEIAKNIKPSKRGELEITSVNQVYLKQNKLKVQLLGRGFAWLDTGTHDSLLEAGNFIESIESRKGLKVGCLEEIAFRMNYINADQVRKLAMSLIKNGYGQYLLNLVENK